MPLDSNTLDRFWSKVNKNGIIHPICGQCWQWTGYVNPWGYGKLRGLGYVHRLSWRIHFGKIPDNLCVCHKCDNPICVNPDHLFLGTNADNTKDRTAKGRSSHGELHWCSKLTEPDVILIRELSKTQSSRSIAQRFNVRHAAVSDILRNITWKHLK